MKIHLSFFLFFIFSFFKSNYKNDTLVIKIVPSEDSYTAIQKALNTSSKAPLKVILNGDFYINDILSTSRDNTTIEFTKNSTLNLLNENKGGIILKNDNCVVKNGTIKGNAISTKIFYNGYGVLLSGVKNCTVKNMTFSSISGISIYLAWNGIIGSSNNSIINNKIIKPAMNLEEKGDDSGILLGYSGKGYSHDNNIIKNNFIDGENVLKIGAGIIGHGNNNVFEKNIIQNVRNYGIISYESIDTDVTLNNTQILNNIIKNVGEIGNTKTVKGMGIYLMKSNNSVIDGNTVINTLRNSDQTETLGAGAISSGMSPYTKITNNIIDNSFMYGIVCSYGFFSEIKNNTITNTRKSGIYIINSNSILITQNTLKNIGEVVFKGYFQDTSLEYIKAMWSTKKYINIPTGNLIKITNNTIYSNLQILYFTGTPPKENAIGNKIKNNIFLKNKIIGNNKKLDELVFFREEINNTNKIEK